MILYISNVFLKVVASCLLSLKNHLFERTELWLLYTDSIHFDRVIHNYVSFVTLQHLRLIFVVFLQCLERLYIQTVICVICLVIQFIIHFESDGGDIEI